MYLSIKVSPQAARIINRAAELAGEKGYKTIDSECLHQALKEVPGGLAQRAITKETEKKEIGKDTTQPPPSPAPNLNKLTLTTNK